MRFLIDTNVMSETVRAVPDAEVVRRLGEIDDADLFLSVVSFGELVYGMEKLDDGRRRRAFGEWINAMPQGFGERLLPVTTAVGRRWGELKARGNALGRPLAQADGLIAATALEHGLRVMTRNVADFEPTGVPTLNPWEG